MKIPLAFQIGVAILVSFSGCKSSTSPLSLNSPNTSYERFKASQWIRGSSPTGQVLESLLPTDSILYAGGAGAAFSSRDNGLSWVMLDTISPITGFATILISNSHLVTGTSQGVFYSTNWGSSWVKSTVDLPMAYFLALCSDSSRILAAEYGGGVYQSIDAGVTWQHLGSLPSTMSSLKSAEVQPSSFAGPLQASSAQQTTHRLGLTLTLAQINMQHR